MTITPSDEQERLENIASDSWYSRGINAKSAQYCARVFSRSWRGSRCLELGPAEGSLTETLVEAFPHVTAVDGSEQFCAILRNRFPQLQVVCSLFEQYTPTEPYDTIILGHVLEHVESPVSLLSSIRNWLAPGGAIYAAVPNARSLHRQAAVVMNLLSEEHELNASDTHHGHRRVYDPESFRSEFLRAGLKINAFGGYWLKPLSNSQIEGVWSDSVVEAYMQVGERYPDIAAEIYVIASK